VIVVGGCFKPSLLVEVKVACICGFAFGFLVCLRSALCSGHAVVFDPSHFLGWLLYVVSVVVICAHALLTKLLRHQLALHNKGCVMAWDASHATASQRPTLSALGSNPSSHVIWCVVVEKTVKSNLLESTESVATTRQCTLFC
jgi:hypothetical protein